jgi:hypothetical protein
MRVEKESTMKDAGAFQPQDLSLASICLTDSDSIPCKRTEEETIGDDTEGSGRCSATVAGTPTFHVNSMVSSKISQELSKAKSHTATTRRKTVKFSFTSEAHYYGYNTVEQLQAEPSSPRKQRRYQRRNSKTPAMLLIAMGSALRRRHR